jgi:hypothetical protein
MNVAIDDADARRPDTLRTPELDVHRTAPLAARE